MDFDHIVAVLNRLDPAAPQPVYFRTAWRAMELDAAQGTMADSSRMWLQTAEDIDRAARIAILFAIGKAAEAEMDRAKPWVALAEAAGAGGAPDIQLVRRLVVLAEHGQPENSAIIEDLKDKLCRLSEFRKAAEAIEAVWHAQLDSVTAAKPGSPGVTEADPPGRGAGS
ncbi:hypothetical protein DWF00_04180 [Bosea caraganae]|uniref:Uncharacterized protein n=1 Tax=Bosea caraganae TaxID=2763117 RepID=A0A370KXC7_9HYPH|nr:hypothetical protein [Bosea caraganae]RDJ19654.1 hypothetical protein DWE98_28685 [Bosea caraganae]RDJ30065.1 hypothetical protein DWF00_04180 [Bosea caraganae]